MGLIAKIIGEASIRLRADSKTLGPEIRRIVVTALKEATTGLRAPTDGVTKPIADAAEKDGKRVQRTFRDIISTAQGMAAGLLSAAVSGARLALIGVAALGALSGVIGLASTLTGLAGAAAQAAGVIALLPAALTAVKAVSATVKLALAGVGESFSALASGDMQAFQESLKGLAPQARAFVTEVAKIKPEFDKIKTALQDTTFDGLSRSVQPLAQRYLPLVNRFFQAIGQSANEAAKSVIEFANNGKTAGQVQQFMENIATAFNQLVPAIKPALAAFLDLGRVGSTFLPGIAQSITQMAQRFADFIRTSADTGALKSFIQTAIDTFNQLGRIIADVAVGVRNVFRIGSQESGGFLNNIEQATQKFREFTESIGGATVIRELFGIVRTLAAALDDVFAALKPLLTPLREMITLLANGLADALRQIAPKLAEFGGTLLEQLKDILPDLIPFVAKLAGGILDILTAVAPLLKPLANLLGALTPLIDPLVRLAQSIIPPLIRVIEDLTPFITGLADALGKIIDFAARVVTAIDDMSAKFASSALGKAFEGLTTIIGTNLIGSLGLLEQAGVVGGDKVGKGIGRAIKTGFASVDPELRAQGVAAINSIVAAMGFGPDLAKGAGRAVVGGYANGMTEARQQAVEAAILTVQALLGALDAGKAGAHAKGRDTSAGFRTGYSFEISSTRAAAMESVTAVINALGLAPSRAEGEGRRAGGSFGSGIAGARGAVAGASRDLADAAAGGVQGVSLFGAGQAIVRSLTAGMEAMRSVVAAVARSIGATITANKGPESADRVMLYPAGQLIIQSLINGMNAKRPLLTKTLQDVTSQISALTTDALDPGTVSVRGLAPVGGDSTGTVGASPGAFILQQTNHMLPGADVNQFAQEVWRRGAGALAAGTSLLNVTQQPIQTGLPAPGSTVNLGA